MMRDPREMVQDERYWRDLVPWLSVDQPKATLVAADRPVADVEEAQRSLVESGYFRLENLFDPKELAPIAAAIERLRQHGWLEVWVFMYDEVWHLLRDERLLRFLAQTLGPGFFQLPDFWAMAVEPAPEKRGFLPHVDGAQGYPPVRPDGMPTALTLWFALSDVTPDESCIYIVPAKLQNEYDYSTAPGTDFMGPIERLATICHRVRCMPATTGTVLGWHHGILHWGSASSPRAKRSRFSLSAEFIRADAPIHAHPHVRHASKMLGANLHPAVLSVTNEMPTPALRQKLIARQILGYAAHAEVVPGSATLARSVLNLEAAGST